MRVVRDAAIAAALMASVPIVLVATRGEHVWRMGNYTNHARSRIAQAELSRSFALPADLSITPMQAGLAFEALQPTRESKGFPATEIASRPEATWKTATLTPEMFTAAAPDMYHGPSSRGVLEAVAKGFTPQETAFLRTLATAPVWREFDVVARASAVDFLGGRFKLPFASRAQWYQMPLPSFKATKEMAYAAVSRAAYHMSIGQRDSAETVLRSVLSFGFAMIDNGTSVIDQLIGNVIVGVGRDALQRFYVIQHDARAAAPALQPWNNKALAQTKAADPPSLAAVRRQLIARSADPTATFGERFESLRQLSGSSCTNVREMMFGTGSDVNDAFRNARVKLARYPSEQALVDLIRRPVQPSIGDMAYDPVAAMAVSTATVAGVVLRNPRMALCTRVVTGYFGGP